MENQSPILRWTATVCVTFWALLLNAAALAGESPYAVGNTTRFIHDETRGYDTTGGVPGGVRTLIAEIWYPVDHSAISVNSKHATYGDYVFGDREMHRRMMTATTFFHLTSTSVRDGVTQAQIDSAIDDLFSRSRNSYVEAPLTAGTESLPVVVMTHGDAGSRYNMETTCEFLAAHGYIVIAPEHTGNSPYAMTGRDPALDDTSGDEQLRAKMQPVLPLLDKHGSYGDPATYGQSYTPLGEEGFTPKGYAQLDAALMQRVNDLRATLKELESLNHQGRFAGRIDMARIGLMGRSFGGATTLAGLMLEDRFKAGIAVVPPSIPDPRSSLPPEVLRPAGEESAMLSRNGRYALGELRKPTLLLSGGEDALIMGIAKQLAISAETLPSSDNRHPILRQAFEQADVPVLFGVLDNANHGSLGVAGPYWWPQLKPNRFPQFFAADKSYTLIEPALAHRIQSEKALAFFDYFVKGDETSKGRLVSNRYVESGLHWEHRNL